MSFIPKEGCNFIHLKTQCWIPLFFSKSKNALDQGLEITIRNGTCTENLEEIIYPPCVLDTLCTNTVLYFDQSGTLTALSQIPPGYNLTNTHKSIL